MNDDFLRRVRRPPSAAFERQLRARLREQEINEASRRRPSWRLTAIALLIGGSALATATYLTFSRTEPSPSTGELSESSSPAIEARHDVPEINRFITRPDADLIADDPIQSSLTTTAQRTHASGAASHSNQSSAASSAGGGTETSRYVSSTGSGAPATTRPIRVVMRPDIAPLATDPAPDSRYARSASFEEDSADDALPTLCAEERQTQPDIVVTSRRMRREEFNLCARPHYNGEVLHATLGHVAIVITRAKSGVPMQLSTRTLRLALLKQVPAPDNSSQLVQNPYTHWNQIDPALEERRIEVLGPAPGTPEFFVFAATVLAPACEDDGSLEKHICQSVREDGAYSAARFDNNFVRQRLWSDPNVVAIMDYRFYAANSDDLLGSLLSGAAPTLESILDGNYPAARTLHAYVNRERYRAVLKVRAFVDDYLRLPMYVHQKVVIPHDGEPEPWRRHDAGPKLTEVKFD